MAFGITEQPSPSPGLFAAFGDIVYQFEDDTDITRASSIKVEILLNGVVDTTEYFFPTSKTATTFIWRISISQWVQRRFKNSDILQTINNPILSLASAGQFRFQVRATLFKVSSSSGLMIENLASTVISNEHYVINAWRPFKGEHLLTDYGLQAASSSRKFLTSAPDFKEVCLGEHEQLAYFSDAGIAHTLVIVGYDAAGNAEFTDLFSIAGLPNAGVVTIGVGPENILALTGESVAPPVVRYSVRIAGTTEPRNYRVRQDCCAAYRLHWVNEFGWLDSYTVHGHRKEDVSIRSRFYEKALALYDQNSDAWQRSGGVTKVVSKMTTKYDVWIQGINDTERNWLRNIAESPNVWLQENGKYIPCYVRDKTHTIQERRERDTSLRFELFVGVDDYTQTN